MAGRCMSDRVTAASGANAATFEYFSAADGNNGARYMKAIRTGGLCLACHGTSSMSRPRL